MEKNAYREMFTVEDRHWWYRGLHDLVIQLAQRYFHGRPLSIFDAGCGTGGLMARLVQAGHRVEGIDASEQAVAFCRQRGLTNVTRADINTWTPAPAAYDLIVSMDVLCHRWVSDEIRVLRTLAAGLRPSGLMMVNYPAFPVLNRQHDEIVMIRERYTRKTLLQKMTAAGLTPVHMSYRLPHAFVAVLAIKAIQSHRKASPGARSDIADIPAKPLNQALIAIQSVENCLIANGFSIPFGSSLFVVVRT